MAGKLNTCFLIVNLFINIGYSQDSLKINKTEADIYWETMPVGNSYQYYILSDEDDKKIARTMVIGPQKKGDVIANGKDALLEYKKEEVREEIYNEMYKRMLRDWGIEFWRRFPNDPRRFIWLHQTCLAEPAYFANIREGATARIEHRYEVSLDTVAKNEWEVLYTRYLNELESANIKLRKGLMDAELNNMLFTRRWKINKHNSFNFTEYLTKATVYAKLYGAESIIGKLQAVYRDKDALGLRDNDIVTYISLLRSTTFPQFHHLASGIENTMRLQHKPLQFKATTTDGRIISIEQYKGKLVLLDFWSLGCSVCIKKMPEIREVYETYKNSGFEVISICISGRLDKEKEKIIQIHDKLDVNWPLVILDYQPGTEGRTIFENYGWQGVPQLLLLDENGRLIQYNGELLFVKGALEKQVKQHLIKNK